mgnify:CR=1 FL=1
MICIYPSAIERFYDEQGNETETVVMKVGNDTFLTLTVYLYTLYIYP